MPAVDGNESGGSWRFGPFVLDRATQELTRDGVIVQIEPQSFRMLAFLVRNRREVVTRDALVEHIWQRAAVTDWAISAAIKSVRVALGDTDRPNQYLRTVHGRGYRFVAEVEGAGVLPKPVTLSGRCILVTEFVSHNGDGDEAYLADGITEDLITDMTRLTSHRVMSRNASRVFAQSGNPVAPDITDVVEGNLRRIGDVIRVNITVSSVGQSFPDWAERFDFAPSSLIAAQDQISRRLAGVLDPDGLTKAEGRTRTTSASAYDHYLRGRFAYYRYDPKGFADALKHFEAATEIDPLFAEAYAHQAYCRNTLYVFRAPGADETLGRAEQLARRAIELDDNSALAHARLGWILGYLSRPDETIAAFDRAVMLDRDNAEVFLTYGETMNRLAQPDRALTLLASAFAKDNYHPPSWEFAKGHARVLLGEFDQAIDHFRAVLGRVERFIPARVQLARALEEAGHHDEAREAVAKIREFAPKYTLAAAGRMFPYPVEAERRRLLGALGRAGLVG